MSEQRDWATEDSVRRIPLSKGLVALVDAEDYEQLIQFKWHASKSYNVYYARRATGHRGMRMMHRDVLGLDLDGPRVDHRNNNGLDNRKSNLRIATLSQNQINRKPFNGRRFKGVRHTKYGTFRAGIKVMGKEIGLGTFPTAIAAARAYNDAATRYFGEFAWLNDLETANDECK